MLEHQQRIGGKLFQEDQLREGFGMLTKVLGGLKIG